MIQQNNRNKENVLMVLNWLICVIFASVSFGNNIFSFAVGSYQMTLYRLLSILVFLAFIIINRKQMILYKKNDVVFNIIPIIFIYSIIELLWCKSFSMWIHDFFFVLMALISLYYLNGFVNDTAHALKLVKCLGLSVAIQAIIGTYEYFTGNYLFLNNPDRIFDYTRFGNNYPVAMMDNVNNFAILLVLGVCLEHVFFSLSKSVILQAYALCKYLNMQGIDAEQICYDNSESNKSSKMENFLAAGNREKLAKIRRCIIVIFNSLMARLFASVKISQRKKASIEFRNKIPHSDIVYSGSNIQGTRLIYDAFISGSDRIWNPMSIGNPYYLSFLC